MIPIATPVYYLGDWAGNVTDDFGVDWIVQTEDGWSSSPPVQPTQTDKAQADGAWQGPGFYGARVINLKGTAIASDRGSMLAAKRRIKAAIGPRALTAFTVAEADLTLTSQVRLSDQIDISDKGSRGFVWSLTVVAADPRRYSADSAQPSTGLPVVGAVGRTYNRTYPYSYPIPAGGTGSVFFNNLGDYDQTPAVITIWGPVINPWVAHVQTGRTLAFGITLLEGQRLVIDLLARTVLLNGTASRAGAVTPGSAWFMLTRGLNEVQFRGDAGPSGTGAVPVMSMTASSAWS